MEYRFSNISLVSNESSDKLVTAVHYGSSMEDLDEEEDSPNRERFVRLMSVDQMQLKKMGGSRSSSDDSVENYNICIQFCDLVTFAENFIDDILDEAEGFVNEDTNKTAPSIRRMPSEHRIFTPRYSDDYPLIEYGRPKFSGWPTIKEFTIEKGADKIDEYLASFNTNEEWLYIIYYSGVTSDNTSKFYEYEATWSLPCREYPIPQATASVFFTIEVSMVLPPECLVNVTFMFESYQLKHKPGINDFNEEWLNYILDSKIGVFKKITF